MPSTFEREHAMAVRVAEHIEGLGLSVHRVRHHPGRLEDDPAAQRPFSACPDRFSVGARVAGTGGGRSLILSAHLDIVPEGDPGEWTHPPFSGHIDGTTGVIYGRGAMDDKAGVVAALAVLEIVLTVPLRLRGDVVFHFVLEDETTGNGTLLCLKDGLGADGAFILDGTRLTRAIGQHAGNLTFGVEVKGKPASVSVSHMGINAAEMLARLALQLREAVFALNAGRAGPWTQFPSPFQLSLQQVESCGRQFTVPDTARARFHMTFPPPFTLARARRFLEAQGSEFSAAHALGGPLLFLWDGFAAEPVCADSAVLEDVLQGCASDLGMAPIVVGPSTGTSDLRHFVAAGIPCLLYGPGEGGNPHRVDEYYTLADLGRVVLLYANVIQRWCGTSA